MLCNLCLIFDKVLIGTEGFDLFRHFPDHLDKFGRLRRRDPRKVEPIRFDSHVFHQVLEKGEFPPCVVITFQVMAFTGMSPGHPHAVGALTKGRQCEFRAHASCTGNSDHTNIRRIFHPADSGEIGRTVTAPVAQEADNFGFPVWHCFISFQDMAVSFWLLAFYLN
jgi:hypothetical protein